MDGKPAPITILLTHLDDARGLRALLSLKDSEVRPAEVVVADGGSDPALLEKYAALSTDLGVPVRILAVPGSVAASREQAWSQCAQPVIAFLDSDEVADARWLARLYAPIRKKTADFAAGPTTGLTATTSLERYHSRLEDWFYRNWVARDVVYAPMGNTIWKKEVFERLATSDGHVFDVGLARGAEDFDVNIRALKQGFRGVYVPDALLRHDHSRLNTARRTLRKKYHYALGEFQVARRHEEFMKSHPVPKPKEPKPWHRIELVEPFVRRWARWKSRKAR
jgi:glycosyltransferase involved in cell wall biosynthesis